MLSDSIKEDLRAGIILSLLSNSGYSSTTATRSKIMIPSALPVALFKMVLLLQKSKAHQLKEESLDISVGKG